MVIESRPSDELRRSGDLPPCRIDEQADAPVLGSGCQGSVDTRSGRLRFDNGSCAGWWAEAGVGAPGFRCSCTCHPDEHGWPGWDRHLGI
jgi:hypothetical protein